MLWLVGMMVATATFAQRAVTVYGYVEDSASGERLPGTTIREREGCRGAAANEHGFFSLMLPEGSHALRVDRVGYAPLEVELELRCDTMLTFKLVPGCLLGEAVVRGAGCCVGALALGMRSLSSDQVRRMAAALGEADVAKALHFLPGVNGGQEGMAGFSVRGGIVDVFPPDSKAPARVMQEIDDVVLSYNEIKALATGNPQIIERANLETEVNKLKMLKKVQFLKI